MESTRRAELRPLMAELQAAAVKSATLIIEAAGFTPTPERMDELSRLLNGFVFSNLTIAPEPGAQDTAGLVDRLLRTFLDAEYAGHAFWTTPTVVGGTRAGQQERIRRVGTHCRLHPSRHRSHQSLGLVRGLAIEMRWNPADTLATSVVGFEWGSSGGICCRTGSPRTV